MSENKIKDVTMHDLAIMVAEGFQGVNGRFDTVNDRFDGVNSRLDKLENRIDKLENEISGLRASVNNYLRLTDERYLELKAREKVIVAWVKTIAEKTGVKIDYQELEKAI